MRQASHSRDADAVSLIISLASTGMATGLLTAGSRTMTAATTQLLPYPVFAGPGAEPSWNHDAAHTFLPRRLNSVSSTATVTGFPAGTSSAATSFATARPSSSGFHRARGEEPVRPVVAPGLGKACPGQHAAHRAFPGLREEPAGQAAERAEGRGGEQRRNTGQQRHQRRRNR